MPPNMDSFYCSYIYALITNFSTVVLTCYINKCLCLCTLICSIKCTPIMVINRYQKLSLLLLLGLWKCCIFSSLLKNRVAFTEILMMLTKPWMKSMTIWRTWDKFRIYCQHLWAQQLILMRYLSRTQSHSWPCMRVCAFVHAKTRKKDPNLFCFI